MKKAARPALWPSRPCRAQRGLAARRLERTVHADAGCPDQLFTAEDQRQPLPFPRWNARLLQQVLQAAAWAPAIRLQTLTASAQADRDRASAQPLAAYAPAASRNEGQHAAQFRQRHFLLASPEFFVMRGWRAAGSHQVQPSRMTSQGKIAEFHQQPRILFRGEHLPERLLEPVRRRHAQAVTAEEAAQQVSRARGWQAAERVH